jgi:hypothetical protein
MLYIRGFVIAISTGTHPKHVFFGYFGTKKVLVCFAGELLPDCYYTHFQCFMMIIIYTSMTTAHIRQARNHPGAKGW